MRKKIPKRLGEILLERKLITEAQLHDALLEQNLSNRFLGAILVGKGWLTRRQVIEALSDQYGLPSVDIKKYPIRMELTNKISSALILDHKCFPLCEDEESVTVAIINPLNSIAIRRVEDELRPRKVKFVLALEEDLQGILEDYHRYITQSIQRMLRTDNDSAGA